MTCISLSRAETGTGALEWFDAPIAELFAWAEAVNDVNKTRKRKK